MECHRSLLPGVIAGALTAVCAASTTPTPDQPYRAERARGVHGGYSHQRIARDGMQVTFHGKELGSRPPVEGRLLDRAADMSYWPSPRSYRNQSSGRQVWHTEFGNANWVDRVDISAVGSIEAEAGIVMEKTSFPTGQEPGLDAQQLVPDVEPTIVLPKQR